MHPAGPGFAYRNHLVLLLAPGPITVTYSSARARHLQAAQREDIERKTRQPHQPEVEHKGKRKFATSVYMPSIDEDSM
jgi:hypothetical protein